MEETSSGFGGLIVAIIIGAIAGWLAGKIVAGGGFGLLGNTVLGVVGSVLASYLLPALGISLGSGFASSVFSAMIGAIVVLIGIRLIKSV